MRDWMFFSRSFLGGYKKAALFNKAVTKKCVEMRLKLELLTKCLK